MHKSAPGIRTSWILASLFTQTKTDTKGTDISAENFWLGLEKTLDELAPKNKELIKFREDLQKKIDDWHIKNKGKEINIDEYKNFLLKIGYLTEEGPFFC